MHLFAAKLIEDESQCRPVSTSAAREEVSRDTSNVLIDESIFELMVLVVTIHQSSFIHSKTKEESLDQDILHLLDLSSR